MHKLKASVLHSLDQNCIMILCTLKHLKPAVCSKYYLLILISVQLCVPVPVKMEGPAQLLTLVPVMWGGQECSVKQVGEGLMSIWADMYCT